MVRSKTRKPSKGRESKRSLTKKDSSKQSKYLESSYLETLPKDFREFLLSLIEHKVRFLLVGGHAVALHGAPRATFDLDVAVDSAPTNLKKLGQALAQFGFSGYARAAEYLHLPNRFMMLGEKPLRIDVLNTLSGVSFAEAWRSRVQVRGRNFSLSALSLRSLVKNKRASGRTKDLLDIELLRERGAKI